MTIRGIVTWLVLALALGGCIVVPAHPVHRHVHGPHHHHHHPPHRHHW